MKERINKTNCYLFLLTLLFFTLLITTRSEILNLKDKCNDLEKEITTIKNEAEHDYQSFIQLQERNK